MCTQFPRILAAVGLVSLTACMSTVPQGFVWGNDSSQWANDGDCDDPRFDGPWAHSVLLPEDAMRDATDCRQRFERGEVFLRANYRSGVTYDNPGYAGPN